MALPLSAAPLIDASPDRAKTDLNPGLKQIGTLKPRRADEISGSSWTLGCETLDRDFADYQRYKDFKDIQPPGSVSQQLHGNKKKAHAQ